MRIYIFILLSLMMSQDSTSLSQEVDEAIQSYENLIEKFPEMKGLNFNLANIHSKTGDLESAMREYEQALSSEDTQLRAHALYNMGNLQFENGNIEESSKLFREALKLSSEDEDILHNYALSQKVLKEEQEQEKQQDQNQENKEDQEKQEEQQDSNQNQDDKSQEKQESSEQKDSEKQKKGEGESDEQKEEKEKEQNSEESKKEEEKQSKSQKPDEQNDEEKKVKEGEPQPKGFTEEEKRNLQEAAAILNALKADKDNLKKKKYKAKGRIKLEKDW